MNTLSPWLVSQGPRFGTLALGVLLSAGLVRAVLSWPAAQDPSVLEAPEAAPTLDEQDLARWLGGRAAPAAAAPVDAASRLSLIGVVATRDDAGAALISVDGKLVRAFRVGAKVMDDLYLRSVDGRRAVLAAGSPDAAPSLTLDMKPVDTLKSLSKPVAQPANASVEPAGPVVLTAPTVAAPAPSAQAAPTPPVPHAPLVPSPHPPAKP